MARIGYARVSSSDQNLDIQIERLKAVGCDIIRSETGSGSSRDGRGELETIIQFLHAGDELVVLRLDRLGRSTRDVLNLVHEIDEKGASLRVLEPEVSTAGPMGRMMITILGMVADMELRFIKDRQKAGIEAAKAEGVYKGRKKSIDDEEIRRRIADGGTKAAVARELNISRMTVYRALRAEVEKPDTPTDEKAVAAEHLPDVPSPVELSDQPDSPESGFGDQPVIVTLVISLEVEINRQGTRGRKRAIADIEEELTVWWDLADDASADGDYAISMELFPDEESIPEALDHAVMQLIQDLGRIADRRYCYVKAAVTEAKTGRTWSGVEPPKARRRRRPPKRKRAPARRKRKSPDILMFDHTGILLNTGRQRGGRCVISKGQGKRAVYYVDADDLQTAWHPDIAKAFRFASHGSAEDRLHELLDGDWLSDAAADYDILSVT